MTFMQNHFDKLLLVALVLCFIVPAIHDSQYAQRSTDLILGALLGLVTGKLAPKGE